MSRVRPRRKTSAASPPYSSALARAIDWWPVLAVFAAGVALRFFITVNSDVSWDITVSEKVLGGARLYVDVIEVNPPATIYLYLPWVALARSISLRPEWVVDAFVFAASGLSLWLSGRILTAKALPPRVDARILAACGAFVLLIIPSRAFAEREHIALIASLPALATFILLAQGRKASLPAEIATGLGAGLAAIIKPYLALGIIFAAAAAAIAAKSWKPLLSVQNWIAAALCTAYMFWVWAAFPAFFSDILPLAAAVYVPLKAPLFRLLLVTGLPFWFVSFPIVCWLVRKRIFQPLYFVPLVASVGFVIAYLLQAKAWPYQSYPALALSCLVLMVAFLDCFHGARTKQKNAKRFAAAFLLVAVASGEFVWMLLAVDVSSLAAPIRALHPHPKIMSLSDDLGVGHPLVRDVDGTWVGRMPSLWMTSHVRILRGAKELDAATDARLLAYAEYGRKIFAEDIARERPDILLLDWVSGNNWLAWVKADPELAEALKAYRVGETIDGVTILSRETP